MDTLIVWQKLPYVTNIVRDIKITALKTDAIKISYIKYQVHHK